MIFLDDGGVMNDNTLRGPEWQRLVGEFFAPRLGGEPGAWAEANGATFGELFERYSRTLPAAPDFLQGWEGYERAWLAVMCEHVGVSEPPPTKAAALAREASLYITPRVRAAFPGAPEAVVELSRTGYTLHTASNEVSWEVDGYLTGMSIRDHFGLLFGPDRVQAMKPKQTYYERAFVLAGVEPAAAVVVDDSAENLAAARAAGARTVLVSPEAATGEPLSLSALAELPRLLRAIA